MDFSRPRASPRLSENMASYADNGWKSLENPIPRLSIIGRAVELPASGAKVNPGGIERIGCHGIAQNSFVGAFLGKAAHQRLPGTAGVAGAINAQFAVGSASEFVRFDG